MIRITRANLHLLKPGVLIQYKGSNWNIWDGAVYKFIKIDKDPFLYPVICHEKINKVCEQLEGIGTISYIDVNILLEKGLYILNGKSFKRKDLL